MNKKFAETQNQLLAKNEDLQIQLDEVQETLRAIRSSEVDALTVSGLEGEQLFTFTGADHIYRLLIEDMSEGALTLTAEGLILYANKRFAEMLKTPLEKVIGSAIHTWFASESQNALQSLLQKNIRKKRSDQLLIKAADKLVPVLVSLNRLSIKGIPDSFCLVATDLTEQKRREEIAASEKLAKELLTASNQSRLALLSMIEDQKRVEEALRESEERFRSLYENATIGMYRTTPDGKVLMANPALVKMLGFKSFDELVKLDLKKEGFETISTREEFQRQIEAKGVVNGYESVWKTATGSTIFVRESAIAPRDKSGKVQYYEGTVEDISERQKAERALRENENFLNSVIENIPNMIFVKEAEDLRFVRFNRASEELTGFSNREVLGKNDFDLFPPDQAEHFIKIDKETLSNKELVDIPEEKILAKKKGERIIHTKKIPILDDQGKPKYLLGISEDITERKQAERSLLILSDTQRQLAQVETIEDLYQLMGEKLLELIPESYFIFGVVDEDEQAIRSAGFFGFGPVYEKLKKTYKIDPAKYSYPQNDMTPEEQRLFRSGRLEEFPGGTYALMVRKFSKSICEAVEKQLKIKKIYTQGLVYQGKYLGVIAILTRGDITPFKEMVEIIIQQASITFNRIKSRNALEESEERFRSLFEDSPVSLWLEDFSAVKQRLNAMQAGGVKDMSAYLGSHPEEVSSCAALIRIIDVNKAGISLFKAKKKEDLLINLSDALSPQSFREFRQELTYLAEGKTKFNWEGKSLTMSGDLIDTKLFWSAISGYEKDLSKVLVLIEDISERKQAEETLKESEERFRGLFEDSPVSLWEEDFSAVKLRLDTLKLKGESDIFTYLHSHPEEVVNCTSLIKILDANKAALKLYGARDKAHLINNLAQIVSIEPPGKFIEGLVTISSGLSHYNYETVNQTLGGETINISLSWTAAPGHEKDLSRVLISIVDITHRKQAEAKLDQLITELRNHSQTEKKNRLFAEALAKNVTIINSSLEAEKVMDSIIDSISEIVPYDAASVMMVKGKQARIVRSKGYQEKGLENWIAQSQFDLNKIKDFNLITRNKKYVITSNTETSKDWTVFPETAWVKSHITSPLIEDGRVVGFLNLDSSTPDFYTEDHAKVLASFSEQVSTALKNARIFEDTQRRMDRMQAMTQIDLAINSSLDINVSLEIVLIQAKDKLNADAVDILLLNSATSSLVFSKAKGFKTDEIRKANFRLGTGLPGRTVLERALIAIPDLRSAPESYFRNLLVEREGFASYYCAPLITKGELKGVMEIYFREPFNADQEWREFLEMLAQQTAIAINNAELLNSLKVSNADLMNAYETTLKGWVDALDMRDHETEGHTRRVTALSLQLALRMGIKDSEIINFERGALLHDIGKVGISDSILNKPGPLTDDEWVIMRQHPLFAFKLLSKSKYLIPALDIPYCHHEKWDGSGYPRGLKGEAIPLAARIFAIVDVWDALISDRPYRKAWTQKQALDHIQEQSGKHFDPKVVSAFLAFPKKGLN